MAVLPAFYISTFSGIGALDVAVRRVLPEAQCLLYVEREIPAVATLAARMEAGDLDAAPVWGDVRSVPTDHLRGRISLVVGGFPCQDISSAGKRTGILGSRSGLFFDLIRLVRDVGAEYVFLENVAALTVRGLDTVLGTLAEIGFAAEWGCLRASDAGAPHGRDRWWCLAWDRQRVGYAERAEWWTGELGSGRSIEGLNRPGETADRPGLTGSPLANTTDGRRGARIRQADPGESNARRISAPVADPLRLQRPGRGPEVRDGRGVRQVREELGDLECQRGALPAPGRLAAEPGPHSAGIALADAACECGSQQPFIDDERRPLGGTEHRAGCRVVDGGTPSGVRLAGRTDAGRLAHLRVPYPPGPGDRDGWATYLDAYPNLTPAIESAVRRGTNGASSRVDRLRGLGNAVVPDQAEWALRLLWFRAFGVWP